jgi:hypothetical protein
MYAHNIASHLTQHKENKRSVEDTRDMLTHLLTNHLLQQGITGRPLVHKTNN